MLDRNGLNQQTALGSIWDEDIDDDLRPGAGTNEWGITSGPTDGDRSMSSWSLL